MYAPHLVKHNPAFDDVPEPTARDLASLDDIIDEDITHLDFEPTLDSDVTELDDEDWEDIDGLLEQAAVTRRRLLHETARDMTRIEHDTAWAFLSKDGSFLGPKGARQKAG